MSKTEIIQLQPHRPFLVGCGADGEPLWETIQYLDAMTARPFEELATLPLDDLTAEELYLIHERGGTPLISQRTALQELVVRARDKERTLGRHERIGGIVAELFKLLDTDR